jgi:hypothetical protein
VANAKPLDTDLLECTSHIQRNLSKHNFYLSIAEVASKLFEIRHVAFSQRCLRLIPMASIHFMK